MYQRTPPKVCYTSCSSFTSVYQSRYSSLASSPSAVSPKPMSSKISNRMLRSVITLLQRPARSSVALPDSLCPFSFSSQPDGELEFLHAHSVLLVFSAELFSWSVSDSQFPLRTQPSIRMPCAIPRWLASTGRQVLKSLNK